MALLARLKPYNVKKGHLTRIYMIDGARFYEERGWYEVPDGLGEKLRELHQDHYDEDSPELFDVCTPEQAEALEQREAKAIEVKATAKKALKISDSTLRERVRALTTRERSPENESGDLTSAELKPTPAMIDPVDDDDDAKPDEDEGRAVEVGRVTPPAQAGKSIPPKPRTRR